MSLPHKQVHAEYSKRMKDADMLETHIIQARVQATAIEERAHTQIVEEVGEAYNKLGLPPGMLYELCPQKNVQTTLNILLSAHFN